VAGLKAENVVPEKKKTFLEQVAAPEGRLALARFEANAREVTGHSEKIENRERGPRSSGEAPSKLCTSPTNNVTDSHETKHRNQRKRTVRCKGFGDRKEKKRAALGPAPEGARAGAAED